MSTPNIFNLRTDTVTSGGISCALSLDKVKDRTSSVSLDLYPVKSDKQGEINALVFFKVSRQLGPSQSFLLHWSLSDGLTAKRFQLHVASYPVKDSKRKSDSITLIEGGAQKKGAILIGRKPRVSDSPTSDPYDLGRLEVKFYECIDDDKLQLRGVIIFRLRRTADPKWAKLNVPKAVPTTITPAAVANRKRGRPRKHPLPVENAQKNHAQALPVALPRFKPGKAQKRRGSVIEPSDSENEMEDVGDPRVNPPALSKAYVEKLRKENADLEKQRSKLELAEEAQRLLQSIKDNKRKIAELQGATASHSAKRCRM